MFVNTGKNLFLPEGDDYSKDGFQKDREEISSEGTSLLTSLRKEDTDKYRTEAAARMERQRKAERERRASGKQEPKSYKELFESMINNKK